MDNDNNPSTSTYGRKGKIIHSQARETVYQVLNFFKAEAENGEPIIPVKNYKERTLAATKISEKTYKSVLKDGKDIEMGHATKFSSPNKKRNRPNPISTLAVGSDSFLRRIVHNFYLVEKQHPTLKG